MKNIEKYPNTKDALEAAQICGEIGEMIGREAVCKQTVTDCNRFGNAAAMREALEKARRVLHCAIVAGILKGDDVNSAFNEVIAALSDTPRNCDVGTVEEQIERFRRFCGTRPCDGCTLKNKVNETLDCAIHWAQLPYEEGDSK